ncbi:MULTISPECIES: EAL domain-containing protein [Bradyrhizobium]|jgi:diguanylate cyclase (GGDEF)-like protein|uniref:EAL domain-containing protein n=1 Tax=Bradyrhizobium TaxID=374 RepID=UPI0004887A48|nr:MULTISPECIES: EAL domain-containing protein [Bradyrhizobium]MCS3453213.1 diguanylate cyclase (GGDEF)-like protein [Bradyrhizobium elkanii]MCS3564679.1 diguanylate cyclase (GGDEF)-like protein [Bradyrhizobium elkanii]MCW2145489.1 diguanylate cyclase (GGDEF)-like protein [Bradyrhizobium elkanii]MCW2355693.1 diguanylate cyclase (GGDEF)-like protein [Bradyrhizobium elkanii]MCW2378316.1 diguanylate cyclase (GGDEF)-like protein [Bradyrhizobium elkanii]
MDSLFGNLKVKSGAAFRFATGRLSRLALTKGSIRSQILIFCLAMSAVAVALGGYSILGIRHAGDLVAKTFDESLMSINYARAAGADFATMRVASSQRLLTTDPEIRANLDGQIEKLAKTLSEDLAIAADRSQSSRAAQAAAKVQEAADAWMALHRRAIGSSTEGSAVADPRAPGATVGDVDRYSKIVSQQVELLVNYTAGDGFLFRQKALSTIKRDLQLNVAGLTVALFLSALFSWLLARRIIGPVAIASRAARSIAGGDLDATIPKGGTDELGTLLTAMETMRDNIRRMVNQEVSQRRSAQARLSDALETSREGVVLLDADGQVALANSRASEFIRLSPQLLQSHPLDAARLAPADGDIDGFASEAQLSDGRWLRVSRSETQEGGVVLVYSDISALKQQKAELHATNLRLDAALTHMSQGLCLYNSEARLQVANRRFCEIFDISPELVVPGMTMEEVLDLSIAAGNHGERTVTDLLAERERSMAQHDGNYLQHLSDGRIIAIAQRPTSDGGWLVTCEDVTEQQRAESQIAFMARHDALTKLPNRTLLAERIELAVAQVGRGLGFAVFCLDLDNFKQVNDTLGHPVGDELLCAVADRLNACVREVDTVARLGGDEFAVIQCGVQGGDEAERLARRIVECVGAPYELNGHRVVVGCSVGISMSPGDGTTGEKLLKNADVALYRAKMEGRGTWRFFEPAMDASLQRRRAIELDLREAMAKDEFSLFYQPLYDLHLDRICGFEALLRWHHPKRGLVSPDQFIPIAEEIGLIGPLGEWVLNRACEQATTWPGEMKLAVNVSAVQFRDADFIDVVVNALAASKLSPRRLELEITESVFLANSNETLATLHKLKAQGLRIALDDFGTGYSSLSYLRSFPFDKLKIDKSFVRDATATHGSKSIVRAVISLGRSLGMTTIAEGIETVEQLDHMRAEGCNEAQGFLLSHPVPVTEIAAKILELRNGFKPASVKTAMAS